MGFAHIFAGSPSLKPHWHSYYSHCGTQPCPGRPHISAEDRATDHGADAEHAAPSRGTTGQSLSPPAQCAVCSPVTTGCGSSGSGTVWLTRPLPRRLGSFWTRCLGMLTRLSQWTEETTTPVFSPPGVVGEHEHMGVPSQDLVNCSEASRLVVTKYPLEIREVDFQTCVIVDRKWFGFAA